MNITIQKNRILWVLGSLILGALGSGLWDLGVKPLIIFFYEVLLNSIFSISVGLQKIIYREIAALQNEINGRVMFSFGSGFFVGIFGFSLIVIIKGKKLLNDVKSANDTAKRKFIVFITSIFFLAFSFFVVGKTAYVLNKQDDYRQLRRIISPYISQKEILMFESKFSLIESIVDYESLLGNMVAVASDNQINVPKKFKMLTTGFTRIPQTAREGPVKIRN